MTKGNDMFVAITRDEVVQARSDLMAGPDEEQRDLFLIWVRKAARLARESKDFSELDQRVPLEYVLDFTLDDVIDEEIQLLSDEIEEADDDVDFQIGLMMVKDWLFLFTEERSSVRSESLDRFLAICRLSDVVDALDPTTRDRLAH